MIENLKFYNSIGSKLIQKISSIYTQDLFFVRKFYAKVVVKNEKFVWDDPGHDIYYFE